MSCSQIKSIVFLDSNRMCTNYTGTKTNTQKQVCIYLIYLIYLQVCMVNSAAFHTFLCHSKVLLSTKMTLLDFLKSHFITPFPVPLDVIFFLTILFCNQLFSVLIVVFLPPSLIVRRQRQPGTQLTIVAFFSPSLVLLCESF